MTMLQVRNLTKQYGDRGILNLSFKADSGSVLAVVGPNGAGKTTLFRCLAGLQSCDSGECMLDEEMLNRVPRNDIGFLPENPYLPPDFTPYQTALYYLQMRKSRFTDAMLRQAFQQLGAWDYRNIKNSQLSQGMLKKASAVLAFIEEPRLLILDEPTNGLDTHSVILFKEQVQKAKSAGAIVLISSHILDFVGHIADDILFLHYDFSKRMQVSENAMLEEEYKRLFHT